jgi:lambda family phage tail tape measure protein
MANLAVTLELDSQGYIRNIRAADGATKSFAKDAVSSTKDVDTAFSGLTAQTNKLMTGMTRLKSALIGAAFGAFARSAIGAADAISDLSKATELSVGRIIELQAALQASGGEAGNAGKLVTEFYKSIEEAAGGSDSTQEAFGRLKVSLTDIGKLNTADLLDKTIKGFENIKDPAQRTAIAIQLFGKSMMGVAPEDLAAKMIELRGTFEQQTNAVNKSAELNDNFAEAMNNVRLAFLTIITPIVDFINTVSKNKAELESMISVLKTVAIVLAAAFSLTVFGRIATLIGGLGRGLAAIPTLFSRIASAGGATFAVNGALMTALRAAAKLIGFIAGGVGAALGLGVIGGNDGGEATGGSTQPGTMGAYRSRAESTASNDVKRPVQTGKELAGQLNSVQGLADGYRRAAQANMDRYTTEVDMLGKSREEQETIKGTAEINKRYDDQRAALEEKRKGAKGQTLALIKTEIANLEDLRTSEIDVYNITRQQKIAYAENLEEVKNILDYVSQIARAQEEAAGFQSQQGQAKVQAFEQVQAQKEAFDLLIQREALEKSIQNLRGSEQEDIKKLFDLELQRKTQLEAIQKIQNLPFEGVGGMKQKLEEINKIYDDRRAQIEATAEATKVEQNSFSEGWKQAGEKYRNNIKTDFEYAQQVAQTFTKGFEDAIVKFVQTGKLSFKDLANSLIADFARIQTQKMLSGIFGDSSGGGGIFGAIGKFFGMGGGITGGGGGGAMANGGQAQGNTPYLIGERGPELFVPQNAGKIVPNHALGGGSNVVNNTTEVTYSIQAMDASSFRSMLARDPEFIHNVAEQGRRQLPIRSRR